MRLILCILLTFQMSAAQQCCVWAGLEAAIQSGPENGLSIAPKYPPNSTCSGQYSWTSSCSGSCITISCTGSFEGLEGTAYGATCDSGLTASMLQNALQSVGATGSCSQTAGITAPAPVVPITASTVSSSAAAGSVGGSIVGSLIAALLSWFLNNFGATILKMVLGKAASEAWSRFKKRISKSHEEQDGHDVENQRGDGSAGAQNKTAESRDVASESKTSASIVHLSREGASASKVQDPA